MTLNIHGVFWLMVSLLTFWRIRSLNGHFCPEDGGSMLVAISRIARCHDSEDRSLKQANFTCTPFILFQDMMLKGIVLLPSKVW
jgi:hypothetical protein